MKFVTTESELVLVLEGREQLMALKAKLQIKKSQVTNLRWVSKFDEWRRWEVRMPGASIPGRILAGSYWTEEGWDFLYIIRPVGIRHTYAINVICIELREHDKYQRVIISADDSDYQHLMKWWNPKTIITKPKVSKKPISSKKVSSK